MPHFGHLGGQLELMWARGLRHVRAAFAALLMYLDLSLSVLSGWKRHIKNFICQ